MTPKEKAKEIVSKYELNFISANADEWTVPAKRCALIAVEQIIESVSDFGFSTTCWYKPYKDQDYQYGNYEDAAKYWQQVKAEINLL